jgi:hypothetical protein
MAEQLVERVMKALEAFYEQGQEGGKDIFE